MFSNVILSKVSSLLLRDSDTGSENVSLIRSSVRWPENMQLKGCIIDKYIINLVTGVLQNTDCRACANKGNFKQFAQLYILVTFFPIYDTVRKLYLNEHVNQSLLLAMFYNLDPVVHN